MTASHLSGQSNYVNCMANSVDPDKPVVADLDPHCLQGNFNIILAKKTDDIRHNILTHIDNHTN